MKRYALVLTTIVLLSGFAAAQSSVQIEIEKRTMEPTPLKTSEYADIWLEVRNRGDTAANGVEVTFNENYPFSVDPDERTHWDIGELVPGEEYQIHLETRVDENAVHGNNSLKFTSEASPGIQIEHKVPVEVRTDNEILAVTGVNKSEKVAPGSSDRLTLNMRNLADSHLKNIEVSLDISDDDLPFVTRGASTKNIEKVAPGERTSLSFRLSVDESAENGVHKLPIDITYENEAGTEFERTTYTGLVVGGTPQLEVGVNNENQFTAGSTDTVTLRVVNRGQGSADFVQLALEPSENYEIISPDTVYLGDMDPDDFQTAEFNIHVKQSATDLQLPVELSYKDDAGEKTEGSTVDLKLYTQQELEEFGLAQGGSYLPIAVVAVLVIAGIYYWRRRKKKG